MEKVRIWDAPVRLFHWLLAACFISALAIATLTSDEGFLFPLHALLGMLILVLFAFRIVWGIVGSRWARFSSFALAPGELTRCLRGSFRRSASPTWSGHNPATSWFVILSAVMFIGLGVTGFMMGRGNDSVEDLHEILAWTMAAFVALHVSGVVVHTLRHRENLTLSMFNGRKIARAEDAIHSSHPTSAVLLLALTAASTAMLLRGYDRGAGTVTIPFTHTVLQVGDVDHHDSAHGEDRELASSGLEHDDEETEE